MGRDKREPATPKIVGLIQNGLPVDLRTTNSLIESKEQHSGNKYHRMIRDSIDRREIGVIDVYSVIEAYGPMSMPRSHAVKKILCSSIRGKGDEEQDIKEAIDALTEELKTIRAKKQNGR